jgi:hypothetical protein
MRNISRNKIKKVAVYWKDLKYCDDGLSHDLSEAYTEGYLFNESLKCLYVKYPTTILKDESGISNHPYIKPKFMYIPKSLITSIEYYE